MSSATTTGPIGKRKCCLCPARVSNSARSSMQAARRTSRSRKGSGSTRASRRAASRPSRAAWRRPCRTSTNSSAATAWRRSTRSSRRSADTGRRCSDRGVLQDVSRRLVETFAGNLATMLEGREVAEPAAAGEEAGERAVAAGSPPGGEATPAPAEAEPALDLGSLGTAVITTRFRDPRVLGGLLAGRRARRLRHRPSLEGSLTLAGCRGAPRAGVASRASRALDGAAGIGGWQEPAHAIQAVGSFTERWKPCAEPCPRLCRSATGRRRGPSIGVI